MVAGACFSPGTEIAFVQLGQSNFTPAIASGVESFCPQKMQKNLITFSAGVAWEVGARVSGVGTVLGEAQAGHGVLEPARSGEQWMSWPQSWQKNSRVGCFEGSSLIGNLG